MRNYQVGQEFVGTYHGKARKGVIEKVGEGYITVKQEDGTYRTFRLNEIQG